MSEPIWAGKFEVREHASLPGHPISFCQHICSPQPFLLWFFLCFYCCFLSLCCLSGGMLYIPTSWYLVAHLCSTVSVRPWRWQVFKLGAEYHHKGGHSWDKCPRLPEAPDLEGFLEVPLTLGYSGAVLYSAYRNITPWWHLHCLVKFLPVVYCPLPVVMLFTLFQALTWTFG